MTNQVDQLPGFDILSQMSNSQLQELFGVRDFFTYEIDVSNIAFGATGQGSFTVQADSNFLWQYAAFEADLAGAPQTDSGRILPLVSLTIQDTGSGRNLMSGNVPITSIFGDGREPFELPTPRFFRAQSQVNVSLLNFSSATNYALRLSFIGTKFWKFDQKQSV